MGGGGKVGVRVAVGFGEAVKVGCPGRLVGMAGSGVAETASVSLGSRVAEAAACESLPAPSAKEMNKLPRIKIEERRAARPPVITWRELFIVRIPRLSLEQRASGQPAAAR